MKRNLLCTAIFMFAVFASRAGVYYVDSSATGANNGSSWANAYQTLAQAMNALQGGTTTDSILVARGTYYPAGTVANNALYQDSAFTILRGGVKMYGGYPSGGGAIPNPVINPVYLDGTGNSYHVMVIAGITAGADSIVLDGFTLRGGKAKSGMAKDYNGISVDRFSAGGLYHTNDANGNKTTLRNCMFTENSAFRGGGLYTNVASPYITHCRFTADTADVNVITAGEGDGKGAGAFLDSSGYPVFDRCHFSGNVAGQGGGSFNAGSVATFANSSFVANTADLGGAANSWGVDSFYNCVFYANTANDGSVLYSISGPRVTNCTMYGNVSNSTTGCALFNDITEARYTNCILYGNTGGGIGPMAAFLPPLVSYCIVEDNYPGTGNTNQDPLFINPSNPAGADGEFGTSDDGLKLGINSPANNTGDNMAAAGILTDMVGSARIMDATVDMGAYERMPGLFGIALSTTEDNDIPFIQLYTDSVWTYYAIPHNPDSIAFAIAWNGNTAARNAATITINTDTDNTVQTSNTSGIWAMRRYWNVNLNGQSMPNPVKVRFYYGAVDTVAMTADAAGSGLTPVNIVKWFKTVGTAYTPSLITASTINNTYIALTPADAGTEGYTAWVEFHNITSFSGGTAVITAGSAISLPVHLLAFSAEQSNDGRSALISWQPGTEQQLDAYEIQRSANGKEFTPVGVVTASGKNNYHFTDNMPLTGKNYYRLCMKDKDGSRNFSAMQTLYFASVSPDISIAPNPAHATITVSGLSEGMELRIITANGQFISNQATNNQTATIDISHLANGVYMAEVLQNGIVTTRLKFVKE